MLYLFAVFLVHMTTMCLNPFTPLSDQERIFLCYIYTEDIMQTTLWDYQSIQNQFLQTKIMRIIWQKVRRITDEILRNINKLILSNVNNNCDENLILWNTCKWKTCFWLLNMSLMFKFSWKMLFYDSRDTEILKATRNKLFASNEKQIDNQTLMLDMLHSCMYIAYTYYCRGVFKNTFWYECCSLLIFVAKKAT